MLSDARSLTDGEQVVLRSRPHARRLVGPVLVLVATLGAAGFAAGRWPSARTAVVVVATLVVLRACAVPWARWLATTLVVTDRRVVVERGVLRRTTRGVPLSRIADVSVERSLGQRLVGSGTLVLDTTGERGALVVRDLPRARAVAAQVADLLDDLADRHWPDEVPEDPQPRRRSRRG